jgi:hypothetical protein
MGRVVEPGEPLWLPEDRAWVFALAEVEADACPDCKRPWSEAAAKESEFAYKAEVTRCHACATAARHVQKFERDGGDTRGLHVLVERKG